MQGFYSFLAGLTVVIHFLFILLVLFGGIFALKWKKFIWIHLPVVAWGIVVEFAGFICPLTPLENYFRYKAGREIYDGDFVIQYLERVIYPDYLTRNMQLLFGGVVIVLNIVIYTFYLRKRLKQKSG